MTSFADAVRIQLWFVVAGLSCTVMGIAGFFSSNVMGMENKAAKQGVQATETWIAQAAVREACRAAVLGGADQ